VFELLNGQLLSLGQLIDLGDGGTIITAPFRRLLGAGLCAAADLVPRLCAVLKIQLVDRDGHLEVRAVLLVGQQNSWQANGS